MKKILFIFGKMDKGGAEIRTINLIKNISNKEYEFHFCVLSGKSGELDNEIIKLGGYIHYIKLDFKFPKRFIKMLKEKKIDIVHSNVLYFSGIILFLAKIAKVKGRITHFRSNGDGKKQSLLNTFKNLILKFLILLFSTDILAVSHSTMRSVWKLRRLTKSKNQIIYNGFENYNASIVEDIRKKYNINKNDILLLHVGRFNQAKNQKFILDFFNVLQKRNENISFKLLLVGNSITEYGDKCKEMARQLDSSRIIFAGVQSNVNDYYQAADIFLFPSIREGLPGSLIESVISRNISIASDIGPNKEVEKYFSKCLYTITLDVDSWIEKVESIIFNGEYLKPFEYKIENSPFYINDTIKQHEEVWSKF